MTYQRNETPEPLASGVESAIDEAGYTLLSDLAGIDCYDTNLRDQPEAYAALDRYREACAKAATPAPGAPGQEAAALKPCRHGHIHCLACMNNRPKPQEAEEDRQIIATYEKLHEGKLGAHWLWCVIEQIAAGVPEAEAFKSFGYYEAGPSRKRFDAAREAAAVQAVGAWQDIATAPEDTLVIVGWRDEEDTENPDRHMFDYIEDGVWQNYFNEHEHYAIAGVARGRSEDAPYTHWMPMGPVPAALPPSGAGEKTS